mmetsp:Transcript_10659/g.15956  ORF Transcript_10659/g.15956 Transcript_10659/m.15956 type:complete len:374 (+) Transcript_10659:513-1634(+)
MSAQQQVNQDGAAFFKPPTHSSGQPQALYNTLMHPAMTFKQDQPFVQHNGFPSQLFDSVPIGIEKLQSSLPGGTTVTNYSMHMQPTQTACTNYQSPFSMQTSHLLGSKPEPRFVMPGCQGMSASAINVSTTSYAAPQAHSPSLKQNTQNQVNLAEVPTGKLAPRSIIALDSAHFTAIHSSSPHVKPTHASKAIPIFNHLEQSQNKPNESSGIIPQVDSPTCEQVKQRERSSYSSACEATLRAQAQQRHANANIIANGRLENPSPVTAACSSRGNVTGKISSGKRTLSEQPKDQPGHKYVKVVGGKVSPLTKLDSDVSIVICPLPHFRKHFIAFWKDTNMFLFVIPFSNLSKHCNNILQISSHLEVIPTSITVL